MLWCGSSHVTNHGAWTSNRAPFRTEVFGPWIKFRELLAKWTRTRGKWTARCFLKSCTTCQMQTFHSYEVLPSLSMTLHRLQAMWRSWREPTVRSCPWMQSVGHPLMPTGSLLVDHPLLKTWPPPLGKSSCLRQLPVVQGMQQNPYPPHVLLS